MTTSLAFNKAEQCFRTHDSKRRVTAFSVGSTAPKYDSGIYLPEAYQEKSQQGL